MKKPGGQNDIRGKDKEGKSKNGCASIVDKGNQTVEVDSIIGLYRLKPIPTGLEQ